MKTQNPLKVPFGKGTFSPVRNARYLQWEDAFDVEVEAELRHGSTFITTTGNAQRFRGRSFVSYHR